MKALKWINTVAFTLMILVNALADLIPIGGNTTGQVSEAYPNLFTPAPVTFAIWGVIYLLLAGFVLYQWGIFDHSTNSTRIREDIGLAFAVSCFFNIAWVICWHMDAILLSVLCIVGLLFTLIIIEDRISRIWGGLFRRIMTKAGFDIYFGWIIAATIANISVLLTKTGWDGWGISADIWTVVILLIGAGIGTCAVTLGHNRLAGIALCWAYTGILIKHISASGYAAGHPFVIAAAIAGIVIMLSGIAIASVDKTCLCHIASAADANGSV